MLNVNLWLKDIFDQTQHEFVQTSTHNVDIPNVSRQEYQLSDIDEEGYVSLLDDNAEMRSDLKLPDNNIELSDSIRKFYEIGEDCAVTVLKACDREMIIDVKNNNLVKIDLFYFFLFYLIKCIIFRTLKNKKTT